MTDAYGVPLHEPSSSSDDDKVEYVPPHLRGDGSASSSSSARRPRSYPVPQWKREGYESKADFDVARRWQDEYDMLTFSERRDKGPIKVSPVSSDEDDIDVTREYDLLVFSEMEEKAAQMLASIKKNSPPPSSPLVLAYKDLCIDIQCERIRLFSD